MDDLSELRDILNTDESADTDAPEPLDGAPPEDADAEPESEDEGDPLSAEERVAALLAEESGQDDADEDEGDGEDADEADEADEESTDESDEDVEALLEEGRRARAERQQAEAYAPYQQVYAETETQVESAKQHYKSERRRITALVHADADASLDRDAYLAQHLDAALDGVDLQRDAWIAQLGAQARTKVQQIREEQARPAWAAHLAAERHLPKEAVARILMVTDPRQMPAVADMLVEARNALASERRKRTRAEREREARRIADNQVHPGATGRPASAKPVELTGSMEELRAIMNLKS